MTDQTSKTPVGMLSTAEAAERRLERREKRFSSERRFKYLGLGAILVAAAFLVTLMWTVVGNSIPAFTHNYVTLPVDLSKIDPEKPEAGKYSSLVKKAIAAEFPHVKKRKERRVVRGLISSGAGTELRKSAIADPSGVLNQTETEVVLSDFADLYVKGLIADGEIVNTNSKISLLDEDGKITIKADQPVFDSFIKLTGDVITEKSELVGTRIASSQRSLASKKAALAELTDKVARTALEKEIADTEKQIVDQTAERAELIKRQGNSSRTQKLDNVMPSLLVNVAGGIVKASFVSENELVGTALTPIEKSGEFASSVWSFKQLSVAEANRKFSDKEVAFMDKLIAEGKVKSHWNSIFFSNGASREPELAGIWGAVVGSFYTMVATLILSFPLGVAAAIYLEEFAPKNRLTDIIEVNINNLAAVPSIVFGLLGLAIFLNGVHFSFFGLFDVSIGGGFRRSAAYAGGMVLALMTLPTIIIASRASLKSVPPSIRQAAFGIGASKLQAAFHHTLPLALPGILTGTILGMARALGETAPLLMIGMVAFIVDVPQWFDEPATVLPVQIYMWADFPEQGFQHKNAAAILVLLCFLIVMNAIAVLLRRQFERRW